MHTTPDPDAAWSGHPVDSTFHRCCRSIGGHGRDCPQGPAAIFATAADDQPAVEHDTTVRASWRGSYHTAVCSCGWQAPVSMSEHAAREQAATHYLAAGGSSDDDSAELAHSMARHPAGKALADPIVIGCWRTDPPRAARRLLELPPDRQRACMAALGYLGDGTGQ